MFLQTIFLFISISTIAHGFLFDWFEKHEPVTSCGLHASAFQPALKTRIINGEEARAHSWPWLVFLTVAGESGKYSLCGSSLLRVKENNKESDILLTAAHCVTTKESQGTNPEIFEISKFKFLAGAHKRRESESGSQTRKASKVVVRDDFRFNPSYGCRHDLAVIKMDKPIAFTNKIRPICLPAQNEDLPIGKTCVAAGWGRNNSDVEGRFPETLQQLQLPVHDAKTCTNAWGSWTYKEDQMICAGSLQGDSATCGGDSGGQLACKESGGSWTLYGATSFGTGNGKCVDQNSPPVFARVSSYVDWINEQVNALTSL